MNKFTTSFIIGLFATILLTSTITASQIPIVNLQKNLESSIDGFHPVIKMADAQEDNINIKADINETQKVNGTTQEVDIKADINETQKVNGTTQEVDIKADINETQKVNGTTQEVDIKADINETQKVSTLSSYDSDNSYVKDNKNYKEKPRTPKTHEVELEVVQVSAEGGALPTGHLAYKMIKHIVYDGKSCEENQYKYCEDLTYRYSDIGTIPGPTIEIYEGDTLILETHVVSMNGIDDYDVKKQKLKPKSPGTFEYFGEKNRELGLFGAIIVHPTYDQYDQYGVNALIDGEIQQVDVNDIKKQYVLYMVGSTFWGMEIDENHIQKPLWTNPTLGADLGDIVQFHILGAAHDHTFHLHAHRWLDPGTTNIIDTKTITPGMAHSFIVQAGNFVGPGNWQYHCHVFAHMEAGMMGNFLVGPPGSNTQSIAGTQVNNTQSIAGTQVNNTQSIAGTQVNNTQSIAGTQVSNTQSVAGASPYDTASASTITGSNFVTFQVTDEPGIWFNNIANLNGLIPELGGSLGILNPGGTAHFIMTDTNTVHTITSLLWPSGSTNMPFDQMTGYDGGATVQLNEPGLHVFTCKVHPYMFAGIIVDDPSTETSDGEPAYDIGDKLTLVNGIELDTTPDNTPGSTFPIFAKLVQTFFKVTNFNNWKDYRADVVDILSLPPVMVKLGGDNIVPLTVLNVNGTDNTDPNNQLSDPEVPGVGEVWINTQFEITEGKSKPGTATKVNTATWEVEQKVSLPEINMNHPHNMWTDSDQQIIYQTMWFDDRLAVFDRDSGTLIDVIEVGESPSHVITNPSDDLVYVAMNGLQGVAEIEFNENDEQLDLKQIIPMQESGQPPTHPHGHWISADGTKMVTPNAFTADSTIYDFDNESIQRTIDQSGEDDSTGVIPIATGIRPQGDVYYVANLVDSTISAIELDTGKLIDNINLLAPLLNGNSDDDGTAHALPIQTPVSPDGKFMVTANTLTGSISIISTDPNSADYHKVVASLPCDPGCHGVNFGFKDLTSEEAEDLIESENLQNELYPYYAYVTSKFANALIVVDPDPNNDGDAEDAEIAGKILLSQNDNNSLSSSFTSDDQVIALDGTGGQGVLAIPNPYPGWVFSLPQEYKDKLTPEQQNPISTDIGPSAMSSQKFSITTPKTLSSDDLQKPEKSIDKQSSKELVFKKQSDKESSKSLVEQFGKDKPVTNLQEKLSKAKQFGKDKPLSKDKPLVKQFGKDKPLVKQFGKDKPLVKQFGKDKPLSQRQTTSAKTNH